MRELADSAQLAYAEQLRATPQDGQRHVLRGFGSRLSGPEGRGCRGGNGVWHWCRSGEMPSLVYIQHQLVRIYLLVSEPEKALDRLEPLLRMPYYLSPGWLKIDPTFAPLRGQPALRAAGERELGHLQPP
jgi:hypothetical protein